MDYSAKSAAIRAARKEIGEDAQPGLDFNVTESGGRWSWTMIVSGGAKAEGVAMHKAIAEGATPAAAVKAAKGKAAKPTPAPKEAKAKTPKEKPLSARAQIEADAARGIVPAAPDFTADTHKPFRKKLEELKALVEAGDAKGLRAYAINPTSSSPKALDRYRNLAVVALEAKAGSGAEVI